MIIRLYRQKYGRYPMRMERGRRGPLIRTDRLTLGSLLKKHGYRTGCVGKWHLGFDIENYDKPLRGGLGRSPGGERFGLNW